MNREQAGYPLNARLFITIRFQAHIIDTAIKD